MDGHDPTQKLRSKTKIISGKVNSLSDLPDWGFDGSSTMQAAGEDSDCMLKPVYFIQDPIRGGENLLVMCEVMNADGSIHESNTRAHLRVVTEKYGLDDINLAIYRVSNGLAAGRVLIDF